MCVFFLLICLLRFSHLFSLPLVSGQIAVSQPSGQAVLVFGSVVTCLRSCCRCCTPVQLQKKGEGGASGVKIIIDHWPIYDSHLLHVGISSSFLFLKLLLKDNRM